MGVPLLNGLFCRNRKLRRDDVETLFIEDALFALNQPPQVRLCHAPAATFYAFESGQQETERQTRVPTRTQGVSVIVTFITAFQKESGIHPKSSGNPVGSVPVGFSLLPLSLESPNTECAVQMDSIQERESETKIQAPLGLLFIFLPLLPFICLPAFTPIAQRIVIVQAGVDNPALHIHARTQTAVSAFEIVIEKHRSSYCRVLVNIRSKHKA